MGKEEEGKGKGRENRAGRGEKRREEEKKNGDQRRGEESRVEGRRIMSG